MHVLLIENTHNAVNNCVMASELQNADVVTELHVDIFREMVNCLYLLV